VYDKSQVDTIEFNDCEFTVQTFSGTGKGGQHRNKHQTSVRVIHNPTGITEKRESRSLEKNVDDAMLAVKARIAEDVKNKQFEKISKEKKLLFGSGMRGDKIRTYRFQDDIVTDHRTHKTLSVKDVMKGNFQKFYKQ
jgi:peptide chain release factor 1